MLIVSIKKSYVNGINPSINSIDDLIEFLKVITKCYELIIVGNSGGGYLSMILGYYLQNVTRVYSFVGLFSLYSWTGAKNNLSYSVYKDGTIMARYKDSDNHDYDGVWSKKRVYD